MEKSRKPKIRFKGYNDDWEQRKLEDLLESVQIKNSDGHYSQDDILACSLGTELNKKTIFYGLRSTKESVKSYRIVNINDVIYTKSPIKGYPNGIVRTSKVVDGIVPSLYCVYQKKRDISMAIDTRFIQSYLEDKNRLDYYLFPLVNVGARNNVNITDKEFLKGIIKIPICIEEQIQIVEMLEKVNHLITLHQRKLDKLINVKKSMLEKMFPKQGSTVPEIRFNGFTQAWEQRELNELALFNPKDELPQTFEYVDLEAVVGTEMLSHRTETRSSAPSRAQRLARAGDLFYQTVRPYQKNNYLFKKHDNNYVFSTGYAQMRPYVDGYFLLSLVQSDCFVKVVLDNCTGTSYPAINANDLAEIEVVSPLDENETQKIGAIFHSIDSLITLHQRKLEKLKNIKKSMLEKMFV